MPRLVGVFLAATAVSTACGRVDFATQDAARPMDAGASPDAGSDSGRDGGVVPPFDAPPLLDGGSDSGPPIADAGPMADAGSDAGITEPTCPPAACSSGCALDTRGGSWTCTGSAVTLVAPGPAALVDIDMTGHTRLDLTVVTCDPTSWVWHLADSPSCNGFGGDSGNFGNDAELYQIGNALQAYGSQDVSPGEIFSDAAFATATGCTLATVTVFDQRVVAPSIALDRSTPALLRIDPPTDSEGVPDARWYLSTDRTYGDATRSGSGLRCMTVCIL